MIENYFSTIGQAFIIGLILDLLIGDPVWIPHPVVAMGKFISFMEKRMDRYIKMKSRAAVYAGIVTGVLTVIIAAAVPALVLAAGKAAEPWIYEKTGWIVNTSAVLGGIMFWQILAVKCLKKEAMKVYDSLRKKDIAEARKNLSMIVGRDTSDLDEAGICRAACETVAENTSDGVIAPMFWFLIGGAPLAMAYKAVNTLDSMIGYKNDRYILFGRFSAILDDLANWIPARITGILMVAGAFICRYNCTTAWMILKRDRRNHKSPNSGYPEAAAAGALMIRLGGPSVYFGKTVEKPWIGDDTCSIQPEHIRKMCTLMYTVAFIPAVILLFVQNILL